jgi:pilus assembly protein Flp/PilA
MKMIKLIELISRMIRREEGQTLTEYGLLLFFIAVVAILAVTTVGANVTTMFENIAQQLSRQG